MRGLMSNKPPVLEFKVCFPMNRWFGLGLGGNQMYNSELVFFMAPPNEAMQKVVATRTSKNGKPDFVPSETSDVYKLISKNIGSCGNDMMEMVVHRVIDTNGLKGSNISQSLTVGEDIPFITAGLETKDTSDDYS
jgi:hypothetical protein